MVGAEPRCRAAGSAIGAGSVWGGFTDAAADGLEDVGARLAITPEGREEQAARTQAQEEAEAKAAAERKQRIDDRLKDY